MKTTPIKHQIDGLVALLLFGVFAVCVLAVLLSGADAYRRLTDRDMGAYERRTCVQYVATRVRQADAAGGVAVGDLGGTPALLLGAEEGYATWVYCHNGWLMELYAAEDGDFDPADGERVVAARDLRAELADGLLRVTLRGARGEETELLLCLRSDEGVAP